MSAIESKVPESRKDRMVEKAKNIGKSAAVAAVGVGFVSLVVAQGVNSMESSDRKALIDEQAEQLDAYETLNQAGVKFSGVDTISGIVVVDVVSEADPSCSIGLDYFEDPETGDWELSVQLTDRGDDVFDTKTANSALGAQTILDDLCPQTGN